MLKTYFDCEITLGNSPLVPTLPASGFGAEPVGGLGVVGVADWADHLEVGSAFGMAQ